MLILKIVPVIPLVFLAYAITVKIYNNKNKNISEARGEVNVDKDKNINTKLSKLSTQIDSLDEKMYKKSNDKLRNFFDKQKKWLVRKGNYYNLNILTYYLLKIPGVIFLVMAIGQSEIKKKIIFIIVGILITFYVEIIYYQNNKEDSVKITKDLFKIYNHLDVMSYSNVTTYKALIQTERVIKNKRFKKAYFEFVAKLVETKDIPSSIEELGNKFDMTEVDSFVTTMTQGVETGKMRSMIENQRNIINKKYLNAKDMETSKKQELASVAIFIFATSVMAIIVYTFLMIIIQKLNLIINL